MLLKVELKYPSIRKQDAEELLAVFPSKKAFFIQRVSSYRISPFMCDVTTEMLMELIKLEFGVQIIDGVLTIHNG